MRTWGVDVALVWKHPPLSLVSEPTMIRNLISRVFPQLKVGSPDLRRRCCRNQQVDVQVLEKRALLTGNVIANFKAGVLSLKGDNLDNSILVALNSSGFQITTAQGTTVNGQASVQFAGSIQSFKANMKGGNDILQLAAAVGGKSTIKMGSGADRFASSSTLDGNLNVNLGSSADTGADTVVLQGATANGSLTIKGGRGAHVVQIMSSQVAGPTAISLGGGDDFLFVDSTSFGSTFIANGGGGNDATQLFGADLQTKKFETHL